MGYYERYNRGPDATIYVWWSINTIALYKGIGDTLYMTGAEDLPTFCKNLFLFEEGTTIPPHIEDYPFVPSFVGKYSIFGWSGGEHTFPLAVDIDDESMARTLAEAHIRMQEAEVHLYGYTSDVYVSHPDGRNERVYIGRDGIPIEDLE